MSPGFGETYLGHGFNTGSGKGKRVWLEIRESFGDRCGVRQVPQLRRPAVE
jgi:hypothetical protein